MVCAEGCGMTVDEAINHADALALARQQIKTLERRFDIASRGVVICRLRDGRWRCSQVRDAHSRSHEENFGGLQKMKTIRLPTGVDFTAQHDREKLLERDQEARIKLRRMGMTPPEMGFKVRTLPEVRA
jgi:hypothetical protein